MFRFTQVCQKVLGVIFCLLFVFGAASAQAQTQSYHVYIDADLDDTTGCAVTLTNNGGSQNFSGFEYRLSVSVIGTTVSATTLSTCSGSTFGGSVALGSTHPIAITDIGTAVTDHIELGLPLTSLTVPGNSVRLVIGTSGDFIATVVPMGGPIIMPLAFSGGETHGIPLLPPVALALLGLAVGFIGLRHHKKHHLAAMCLCLVISGTLLSASLAWAAGRIPFDGNLTGWSGIPVLATANTGDHTGSIDLIKLYAAIDDGDLKLRIDANSGRASTQPPVPAPIPGDPLDARLPTLSVTGVQHLAINQPWSLNLTAKDSNGTVIPVTVHPSSAHPSDINISGANPLSFTWTPNNNHIGQHIVTVTATDSNGRTITHDLILAVTNPADLPVNPETIAPPLVPGSTPFIDATEFIYTGSDPIQQGVVNGTIEAERAAILRGLVKDRNNQPLAGVTVSILDHPEYGATKTRADGWFDLGVNGGGILVLEYQKPGYLRAQRKVDVPWRDYAIAEDVVLITLDTKATPITMGSTEWQAAIGTETNDERGKRTAVALFPPNTTANLKFSDGTTKALNHLTFRVTEFTVGENGADTMPGELPISVIYTYAAEYSADEAIAAGTQHVEFNQPVWMYLDNFLNIPTGMIVPSGWYDYSRGAWIGDTDGSTIKILDIQNGLAVLQVTEAARAATAAEYAAFAITDDERAALAKIYPSGKTLWRVPMTHLTPWDLNFTGLPDDAEDSDDPNNNKNDNECKPGQKCTKKCGCDVFPYGAVSETINIPGSPFDLVYHSNRALAADYTVPLLKKDKPVSKSLKKIIAKVDIAGRRFIHEVNSGFQPGMKWIFRWDGKDAYGRAVYTGAEARFNVVLQYPYVITYAGASGYKSISSFSSASRSGGGAGVTLNASSMLADVGKTWTDFIELASPDVLLSNAGGWTLSGLSFYNANQKTVHTGGGNRRSEKSIPWHFSPIASVPGSAVTDALPASDGTIYVVQSGDHVIGRLSMDGTLTLVAGNNGAGYSGDGGLAINAQLANPGQPATGIDGSLYFLDQNGTRIRRVDPAGVIHTIAGNGQTGTNNQIGDALATPIKADILTVDRDGNIFAGHGNQLIQISATGYLTHIDNNSPINGLAADPRGGLWISDQKNIHFLSQGGHNSVVAGGGTNTGNGAGLDLNLRGSRLIPDRIGGVYFYDNISNTNCHLDSSGYASSYTKEVTHLLPMNGIAFWNRNGNDFGPVSTGLPEAGLSRYNVAQEDGLLIDVFDNLGRHIEVRHAITGGLLYSIEYGNSHYPQSITNGKGQTATLARDGDGKLIAIIGFNGEQTLLRYNGILLTEVELPENRVHRMEYDPQSKFNGLMTAYIDPMLNIHRFTYNEESSLIKTTDPVGGGWSLNKSEKMIDGISYIVDTMTSAEGRNYTYRTPKVRWESNKQQIVGPDGLTSIWSTSESSNGFSDWAEKRSDGVNINGSVKPDHIYGMAGGYQTMTARLSNDIYVSYSVSRQHGNNTWLQTDSYDHRDYITRYNNGLLSYSTPAGQAWIAYVDDLLRPSEFRYEGETPIFFHYDNNGNVTGFQQSGDVGNGNSQTRSLTATADNAGRLTSLSDALGYTTSITYNSIGQPETITQPGGGITTYKYDANGNVTELINPSGVSHIFEVDGINQLTGQASTGGSTVYRYNKDRELVGITRPGGHELSMTYNANGRITSLSAPEGDTVWHYDNVGLLTGVSGADVPIDYIRNGTLPVGTKWKGPISGSFRNYYLNMDRGLKFSSQQIEAGVDQELLNRKFDGNDRLTSIGVNGMNNSVFVGYGSNGKIAGLSVGSHASEWRYNDFGEAINVAHTGIHNVASLEAMRSAFIAKASILKSELLTEIARQGTCARSGWTNVPVDSSDQWVYPEMLDEARLAEITATYGPPVSRSPDWCTEYVNYIINDMIASANFAGYDWAQWVTNDIQHLHDQAAGGAHAMTDLGGQSVALNDTTSFVTASIGTLFQELESIRSKIALNLPDIGFAAQFVYEYDAIGRIVSQNEEMLNVPASRKFEYDAAGRISGYIRDGARTTWEYDINGNRIKENGITIATYSADDRMMTYRSNTYSYNAAGDLQTKQNMAGTTSYAYDSFGNLKSVTLPDNTEIDYLVDPVNRRVGKQVNGVLQYGLLYQDGFRPIAETTPLGGIRSVFLYADKGNVPTAMKRDGKMYRIISDHLGSVRAVIDIETGLIAQELDYDVWGNVIKDTNPGYQPFGFAGGIYDADTGLIRFGARDYDAETGRWTAKDPIGFAGGDTNFYGYVANDPVNAFDPLGMQGCKCENTYSEDSVEYWIYDWVSQSESWEKAFELARGEKLKPHEYADNRTSAEHYIFARIIRSADEMNTGRKILYKYSGLAWGPVYQAKKALNYKEMGASPPSMTQMEWEMKGWLDQLDDNHNPRVKVKPGICR